jgi:hypothetical protein
MVAIILRICQVMTVELVIAGHNIYLLTQKSSQS